MDSMLVLIFFSIFTSIESMIELRQSIISTSSPNSLLSDKSVLDKFFINENSYGPSLAIPIFKSSPRNFVNASLYVDCQVNLTPFALNLHSVLTPLIRIYNYAKQA